MVIFILNLGHECSLLSLYHKNLTCELNSVSTYGINLPLKVTVMDQEYTANIAHFAG